VSETRTAAAPDLQESYAGRCSVCGLEGTFIRVHRSPREGYACGGCGAGLRWRNQAEVLLTLYSQGAGSLAELIAEPQFRALTVYEPGIGGPFRTLLSQLPAYSQSHHWPGVEPGEVVRGVRCETLEALTFPDRSLDLVITSDLFEHVRRPWHAFAELRRAMRPGARHVFTVPVEPAAHSQARVDVTELGDLHLLRPRYHRSPTDRAGSLVYTDFGLDLPERLESLGFEVHVDTWRNRAFTFTCRRPE
jgi:SAM-dependent methyltransferase